MLGASGESRAREPEVEVRRMEGLQLVGAGERRRVHVVGKEGVWNVLWGRRRWRERDLGSVF